MNEPYQTPSRNDRRRDRTDRLSDQGILSTPCRTIITPNTNNKKRMTPTISKQPFTNQTTVFYLIRHGQSLGQTTNRQSRRTDERLLDCGLSKLGMAQAKAIVLPGTVQLIVSSPLLRAIATACLANATQLPILIHYHLREIGSLIPENIPRSPKAVERDLQKVYDVQHDSMDWDTLRPDGWPHRHDESPKLIRRDRVSDALFWLAKNRPEKEIAVFCHFHVIQAAVGVRAENATIIACEMCTETGELRLVPAEYE